MSKWVEYHKTCEECGEPFTAERYDATLCSPRCRKRKQRRPQRFQQKCDAMLELRDYMRSEGRRDAPDRDTWEAWCMKMSRWFADMTYRD